MNSVSIIQAESPNDILRLRELFLEYARGLNFSLCFQGFDQELSDLPGAYRPPDGRALLALYQTEICGCVALRKIADGIGELKRLYVRSAFRGKGIGKKLAQAVLDESASIGYAKIRIDTLASMKEAIDLYQSLGFVRIEAYYPNPIESAIFLERTLAGPPGDS
jgi:putative acetyltransferase